MQADLHCHTRYSDSSVTPGELIDYAARIELGCLAVTDHDTFDGCAEAAERAKKYGIKVIEGVEVSTYDYKNGKKVHLLCYAPVNRAPVSEMCAVTLKNRNEAGLRMIEKAASKYPLTAETVKRYAALNGVIYKQHIMDALFDMGYATTILGPLFRELFSKGGLAREEIICPEAREAIKVLKETGGIVVLAHPGVYGNFDIIGDLCGLGLDGIEVNHPRQSEEAKKAASEAAERYGLIKTGGSDFHGGNTEKPTPLATCTADAAPLLAARK